MAQAHLLVPARSAEDVLYRDELETRDPRQGYASRTPTAGAPPGWTGWRGRIYAAMLADVLPGPATQCFVCGPTAFVEPLNDLLVAGGHIPRDVHSERFGPSGG